MRLILFQMRRDTNNLETRQSAPIQGSSLTDIILQSGAIGKVTKMLSPGAPAHEPGANDPSKIGDGSGVGPPSPESGAGPHSGPGYVAAQKEASAAQKQATDAQ